MFSKNLAQDAKQQSRCDNARVANAPPFLRGPIENLEVMRQAEKRRRGGACKVARATQSAHAGRREPLLGARPYLIHEVEEIPRPAKQFGFLARVLGNGSATEEP